MKLLDVVLCLLVAISFCCALLDILILKLCRKDSQPYGEAEVCTHYARFYWAAVLPIIRFTIILIYALLMGTFELLTGAFNLPLTSFAGYVSIPLVLIAMYHKGFFGGYIRPRPEDALGIGA